MLMLISITVPVGKCRAPSMICVNDNAHCLAFHAALPDAVTHSVANLHWLEDVMSQAQR